VPFVYIDGCNLTVFISIDIVFHLHGFQNDDNLSFFTVSPTFTLISRITPGSGDFTPDLPVEAAAGFTTGVAGAAGADVAAGRATGLTTTFGAFSISTL